MAIVFELWVETRSRASLDELKAHFSGLEWPLVTGRTVSCVAQIVDADAEARALVVHSPDLSDKGVRTVGDAVEATEVGLRLYARLRTAPDFAFARVAWDPENVSMSDLAEFVHQGFSCVVDDALYRELGAPPYFSLFREGYWWQRYRGEAYDPLFSNDQQALNERCRELFPQYFDV